MDSAFYVCNLYNNNVSSMDSVFCKHTVFINGTCFFVREIYINKSSSVDFVHCVHGHYTNNASSMDSAFVNCT